MEVEAVSRELTLTFVIAGATPTLPARAQAGPAESQHRNSAGRAETVGSAGGTHHPE